MGELAAVAASACWAGASILFTRLRTAAGPLTLNLWKCALAVVLLGATRLALRGDAWPAMSAADSGWLLASGVVGLTLGDTLLFLAFGRIGPRRTLLLSTATPPMTALLAVPALGEPLSPGMIAGMALTIAGIAWVVSERAAPGTGAAVDRRALTAGVAFATGSAFCQASANVLTKLGGTSGTALDMAITRLAAGAATLTLLALAVEGRRRVTEVARPGLLGRVAAATLVGTYFGVWLQVAGLRYTDAAGVAATLSSTSPLFVLPLAAVFLDDRPSVRSVAGAAIAVGGIAVLFLT